MHAGEIVGLAGVQGNGQDELVECLAGLRRPLSGKIAIGGAAIARADPRDSRAAGLAYIPADRARVGLSLMSRVWENMTLGHVAEFRNGPLLRGARGTPAGRRADPGIRRARRRRRHAGAVAVRRQPAEGPARPRADRRALS